MKTTRVRGQVLKGRRGRRLAFTLILGLIISLFLLTPMLAAGANPGEKTAQETGIQLPEGAEKGDGEHYMGLLPSLPSTADAHPQIKLPTLPSFMLSSSVDLSGQLPPVGDQEYQNSCVGWAVSYYYKSWSERREHTTWDLTNPWYQFSPSFVYNQINGGMDEGARFSDAFALLEEKGDLDIAEMPYIDFYTDPTPSQVEAAKPYRIPGDWGYFWLQEDLGPYPTPNNIATIKTWLNGGNILVMGIPVYMDFPDFWDNPAAPYYDYDDESNLAGLHAVCICGYDDNINPSGGDADHKGGFRMVNSWGPDWNGSSAGYLYLSYDFVKHYAFEAWTMNDLSPDSPTITSVSPNPVAPDEYIYIYGYNFGSLRRNARVSFNGADIDYGTRYDDLTYLHVPYEATSGPLTVYDWDGAPSNQVYLTLLPATPYIWYIQPVSGTKNTVVDLEIQGWGYAYGATVRLEGNGVTIYAQNVWVSDIWNAHRQINCTLDLAGAPLGQYDVVVTNPGDTEGRLVAGFKVANICGTGAGASLVIFGITMGLLGLAGTGGLFKRRKRGLD